MFPMAYFASRFRFVEPISSPGQTGVRKAVFTCAISTGEVMRGHLAESGSGDELNLDGLLGCSAGGWRPAQAARRATVTGWRILRVAVADRL